jgi:cysteine-rich repeat protein
MRRLAPLAAMLLVSSASTSAAFAPARGERPQAVRAHRPLSATPPARARAPFAPLAQSGWRASWDRDTGVAVRLWGGTVATPGAVADPRVAERAARAFLVAHLDVLAPGARVQDFVVVANRRDGDLRTVGLAQTWQGLAVHGGQLGFVFGHDRLFAIGSSAWPDVRVVAPTTRPPARAARARAEAWVAAQTGHVADVRADRGRVVLPLVRPTGALEYHLADVLELAARDAPDRWHVYVGLDGTPLYREPLIRYATATLELDAGVRYASGTRARYPAPHLEIVVDGAPTATDADGGFTWPGTTAATIVPSVAGAFVNVLDQSGMPATASLVAQPGEPVAWSLATDELGDAQVSTYVYGSLAKQRARQINPSIAAWLDGRQNYFVNKPGSCNAFSTGDDVYFYRGSAECENTARLADVVFHEFGHSLHKQSVIEGMGAFEVHLSEGLADFFAAILTGDSAVGRGFFRTDEPLRDIDPYGVTRVYPLDFDFDPHISGLIIAGALWDLRRALVQSLGETEGSARTDRIFAGVMQLADDIGTTYVAALIADDDDGDLGNGTPNSCAIERAFGAHGLVPDYVTTTVAPPIVDGLALEVVVTTPTGTTCPPPAIASLTATWWSHPDEPQVMALAAEGPRWRGAFPAHPPGTVLRYRVDVVFDDGTAQVFPNNPADPTYQLFVGPADEIWCEPLNADPNWTQMGNLGFEWEWDRAGLVPNTPDAPYAYTGTHVLGTDLSGNGYYRPNMEAWIETPPIDVASYERVHLVYWRWLTVEDGRYDQATIEVNGTEVWTNARSVQGTLDHVDREWRQHHVDVTQLVAADGTISVRWALATDFGKELGGWTLDDVCLLGLGKRARCGDSVLDDGEQCDDGNTTPGDGCDEVCGVEILGGGGGGCCSGGGGPGSLVLALGTLGLLGRRRRH